MRNKHWAMMGSLLGMCCILTGCSSAMGTNRATATATTIATAMVVTPTPPIAASIPAGWRIYRGQHFSVAYPPTWQTKFYPTYTAGGTAIPAELQLIGPGISRLIRISITENLTAAQQQSNCQLLKSEASHTAINGVTWWYSDQPDEGWNAWAFIATHGEEFGFGAYDKTAQPEGQSDYHAVLATFRPEFTTSACN